MATRKKQSANDLIGIIQDFLVQDNTGLKRSTTWNDQTNIAFTKWIREFQARHNIEQTGNFGEKTLAAFKADLDNGAIAKGSKEEAFAQALLKLNDGAIDSQKKKVSLDTLHSRRRADDMSPPAPIEAGARIETLPTATPAPKPQAVINKPDAEAAIATPPSSEETLAVIKEVKPVAPPTEQAVANNPFMDLLIRPATAITAESNLLWQAEIQDQKREKKQALTVAEIERSIPVPEAFDGPLIVDVEYGAQNRIPVPEMADLPLAVNTEFYRPAAVTLDNAPVRIETGSVTAQVLEADVADPGKTLDYITKHIYKNDKRGEGLSLMDAAVILNQYASNDPDSGNPVINPEKLARFAKDNGIDIDAKLRTRDPEQLATLVTQISAFNTGKTPDDVSKKWGSEIEAASYKANHKSVPSPEEKAATIPAAEEQPLTGNVLASVMATLVPPAAAATMPEGEALLQMLKEEGAAVSPAIQAPPAQAVAAETVSQAGQSAPVSQVQMPAAAVRLDDNTSKAPSVAAPEAQKVPPIIVTTENAPIKIEAGSVTERVIKAGVQDDAQALNYITEHLYKNDRRGQGLSLMDAAVVLNQYTASDPDSSNPVMDPAKLAQFARKNGIDMDAKVRTRDPEQLTTLVAQITAFNSERTPDEVHRQWGNEIRAAAYRANHKSMPAPTEEPVTKAETAVPASPVIDIPMPEMLEGLIVTAEVKPDSQKSVPSLTALSQGDPATIAQLRQAFIEKAISANIPLPDTAALPLIVETEKPDAIQPKQVEAESSGWSLSSIFGSMTRAAHSAMSYFSSDKPAPVQTQAFPFRQDSAAAVLMSQTHMDPASLVASQLKGFERTPILRLTDGVQIVTALNSPDGQTAIDPVMANFDATNRGFDISSGYDTRNTDQLKALMTNLSLYMDKTKMAFDALSDEQSSEIDKAVRPVAPPVTAPRPAEVLGPALS